MGAEIPRRETPLFHRVLQKDALSLRGPNPLIQIILVSAFLHFRKHRFKIVLIGGILCQIGQFQRVFC